MMVNTDASSSNTSDYKDKENGGVHPTSEIFQSAEGIIFGRRRVEIIDEALSSKRIESFDTKATQSNISLRRMQGSSVGSGTPFLYSGSANSKWQHFTRFNINQKTENALASDQKTGCGYRDISWSKPNLILGDMTSVSEQTKSTRGYRLQPKSPSQSTGQWTKSHKLQMETLLERFTERQNLGVCACTSKENIPGQACAEPFTNTKHSDSNKACKCSHHSEFLLSEKERNCQIDTKILGSSLSGLEDASLKQLGDTGTDNFSFQLCSGEHSTRMQTISGGELFPSYNSNPKLTKLDNVACEEQFPCRASACSIGNVETLRICTTMDSVDRAAGWHPMLSNAEQYMLMTEKTDMDLGEGDQAIRESTISAGSKKISFNEMHTLPPGHCCFGTLASKVQPLGNTIIDKTKEGDQFTNCDIINRQKVSSLKTDTMDTDIHQWTSSSAGVTSSKSVKDTAVNRDSVKYMAATIVELKGTMVGFNAQKSEANSDLPSKQDLRAAPITELLDLNLELPPCLDTTCSVGNKELSTSVTESLEAEQILPHVGKQEDSNSSHPLESSPCLQPSSRWVKRLRLTSLDSLAVGTKAIEIGDASSSERVNKLFSRITNYSKSNSELTLARCLKERQQFDKAITSTRTRESSMNSLKKYDSWIHRWCHNSRGVSNPQAKPEARVLCEPLNARVVPANIEGKCPSIAAMALMGKAVKNFRPCDFRRRGSLIVWNT